tara:strand:+ start:52 stop:993 length:942 start_codon:yes stop_codon:yes gene_type:complete
MQKATVYRSTGIWYDVKLDNGDFIKARIKGKFRTMSIKTTNPVAVGDIVYLDFTNEGEAVIKSIEKRKNYIIRKSVNLSKEAHIIASNIDLAVLLVTVINPVTSPGFIDRFTVTAQAYNVPLLIAFNKIDIYDKEALKTLEEFQKAYQKADYSTINISVIENKAMDEFYELIKNKTVLVSGNSGAGKSTLINKLIPDLSLKTGSISKSHNTGKHTTTFAEMFDMDDNTKIIDSPGIKGFGLVDFQTDELARYFPEMLKLLGDCKFHNCRHINEPGCRVIQSIEDGEFSVSRYNSYLAMYYEDNGTHYRQNNYI